MNYNIKSNIHDGMMFFWTSESIKSKSEVIGFYFDFLGFPNKVHRCSLYGQYIESWEQQKGGAE